MYVLELSFSDDARRLAARPAHRAMLGQLHADGRLVMAGPWQDDTGAMLVFAVDDEDAVREIMAADPYYRTPGVTVESIRSWRPVVA